MQARLRHKDAAITTLVDQLAEAIAQRDAAHRGCAHAKTKTWELIKVWQGGHAHREAEMDELVNAYMDEERHWVNCEDEPEGDGDDG